MQRLSEGGIYSPDFWVHEFIGGLGCLRGHVVISVLCLFVEDGVQLHVQPRDDLMLFLKGIIERPDKKCMLSNYLFCKNSVQ